MVAYDGDSSVWGVVVEAIIQLEENESYQARNLVTAFA